MLTVPVLATLTDRIDARKIFSGAWHQPDAGVGLHLLSAGDPGQSNRARPWYFVDLRFRRTLGRPDYRGPSGSACWAFHRKKLDV
jgi:hypothetical protein